MAAYDAYLSGAMQDHELDQAAVAAAVAALPPVPVG